MSTILQPIADVEVFPGAVSLLAEIARHEVVSFDYFDTLFVRNVIDPEDVFDILGGVFGIDNFKALRREAQTQAFARMHEAGKKEITLKGIYDCFSHPGVESADLADAEMSIELAIITPNRELINIFHECLRQGKKVVLTSDMYLPEIFFRESFRRHGLPDVPYFISAERNATKRDFGELFDVVVAELGVSREKILHIGDNPHGDIKQAKAKGVTAFLYTEHRRPKKLESKAIESSIATSLYRRHPELIPQHSFVDLGYSQGGAAALGYLQWIAKECAKDQVEILLFMSRDGYLLHEIANRISTVSLPSFHYFYGSRTAFTLAAIDESNFSDFFPFFLSGAIGLSAPDVLERIGVPVPAPKVIDQLGLEKPLASISREEFEAFLVAYKREILKVCYRNRRALFVYLKQLGISPNSRIGLVDIGWNATSQEAFELATRSLLDLDVTGYYFCLADNPECLRRRTELDTRAMVSLDSHPKEIVDSLYSNRVAVELLFSAPHASVIGWDCDNRGGVIPVTDARSKHSLRLSKISSDICEGVKLFADTFTSLVDQIRFDPTSEALVSPLIEFVTTEEWKSVEIIRQVADFDNWAIRRAGKNEFV